MSKVNYLNVGCGTKFHQDWTNVDMYSSSPFVIAHNLLDGLPFSDNTFDVVYHSQVLEHFPKEKALGFIKECYRVLKPGGIIRVVVPDLENIVDEYKKLLDENLKNSTDITEANYEWILLEMYDQTIRNITGGTMTQLLQQPTIINEKFILERIGFEAQGIREEYLNNTGPESRLSFILRRLSEKIRAPREAIRNLLLSKEEKEYLELGKFRLSGEIHYWMYDRFSLKKILERAGFVQMEQKKNTESNINDWASFKLDLTNETESGSSDNCLYMEAVKPLTTNH